MIDIFREKLLHLIHCRTLSNKGIRNLLEYDPQLAELYKMPLGKLQQLLLLKPSQMKRFSHEFHTIQLQKLLELYTNKNISAITFYDQDYPVLLREIHDPPLVLFTIGDKLLLQKLGVAIVGARDANKYAQAAIDYFLPPLLEKELIVISGLAKGTDTVAHERTLYYGGKTIGVLGGGFFHIYPHENRRLAEIMKQNHLLLTEYPPIQRPEKWHFPMRNRIISGLAQGVIIVQAKSRSGSLITADYALEAGREVFALPGQIDDPLSAGTNYLIQQGAKLVTSGQDILEELYLSKL